MQFLLLLLTVQLSAQEVSFKEAKKLYKKGSYASACDMYYSLIYGDNADEDILEMAGLSCLKCGQASFADQYFTTLVKNERKYDDEILFYLGRAKHLQQKYTSAAQLYKSFLKKSSKKDDLFDVAKLALIQASNGARILRTKDFGVVQNLGAAVNSVFDEAFPIPSPTVSGRYYFASANDGTIGGKRNKKGIADDKEGYYRYDILKVDYKQGSWTDRENMGELLNSAFHDYVLDFDAKGSTMYFYKGMDLEEGALQKKEFSTEIGDFLSTETIIDITKNNQSNVALDFWKDNIIVFSADLEDGYGGRDLYMSTKIDGTWSAPKNLGPGVNTSFEETDPFLAKDGMTLYFSSNGVNSFGGFDLFESKFIEQTSTWAKAKNLGSSLNSPGNDRSLKIAVDGRSGLFSSDRPGGIGGGDIYMVYLENFNIKEPKSESNDVLVNWISKGGNSDKRVVRRTQEEVKYLKPKILLVESIYYREDVLTKDKLARKKLNKLLEPLKLYPSLEVILEGHTAFEGPEMHNLFYSARMAQQAKDYLIDKGISAKRISARGYGTKHPLVIKSNTKPSAIELKYNKRVFPRLINKSGEAIKLKIEEPQIAPHLRAKKDRSSYKGLNYRIRFKQTRQMLVNEILNNNTDIMLEREGEFYNYYLEGYENYFSAKLQKTQLELSGFFNVIIVPYLGEHIIERQNIVDISLKYKDLVNYLSDNQ